MAKPLTASRRIPVAAGATRSIKVRKNGKHRVDAKSTMQLPVGVPSQLMRILRPQAAYRWLLPSLASLTPQYIETILRGALMGNHGQQWELFDLMLDTWPELSACHQELVDGVMRRKLMFEPFHEEDEKPSSNANERMKLASSALKAMKPMPDRDENALEGTIRDIIDGWFRGISVIEILWHVITSSSTGSNVTFVAPQATAWVHPAFYAFDQNGVLGLRINEATPQSSSFVQPRPDSIQPFPPNKFLIAIHKARSGSALAGALLRPLAWWWCAANFSSDWLLNLAQVFGLPFRWANYASAAPQPTIDAICDMLQNMGSAGWAAFPEGTTLELKEPSNRGSNNTPQGELLDRADRYARMLILGQTMSGGSGTTGKGGGQAFGTVEERVKEDRIDAVGRFICEVLNRQLIPSILELNFGDSDESPCARFLEEEEGKLDDAQRDKTLGEAGLEIPVSYLRKKYGIPEPGDGEETVGGSASPEDDGAGPANALGTTRSTQKARATDKKLQSRIAHLFSIEDDALFAKELSSIADQLTKTKS